VITHTDLEACTSEQGQERKKSERCSPNVSDERLLSNRAMTHATSVIPRSDHDLGAESN
jgi:hypothetical protein